MDIKRKASASIQLAADGFKRQKIVSSAGGNGEKWRDWPAPSKQIDVAQEFIKDCVRGKHLVLLVPDKDADGLSSGKIMHNTLVALGLPLDSIKVHMVAKCASVFKDDEKEKIEAYGATRIIIMDQGSRGGPPLASSTSATGLAVRTLIVDHHESDTFPEEALVVSACHSPPIATSSLLTYLVCLPLLWDIYDDRVREECAIFALLGVYGDLGPSAVKWDDAPWPAHLGDVAKKVTKKALTEAVSMMNAPRRTAEYPVDATWKAILNAHTPKEISQNPTFVSARARVNAEVERCTHTAPTFSKDGRIALITISSGYQIHPVIATRWAGHLKSYNLQMVMVANVTYHPSGMHTNFSCRIPTKLRKLPEIDRPNLIAILKDYGKSIPRSEDGRTFLERVGADFAKGHKEATGGIILTTEFERLVKAMEIGIKPPKDHKLKSGKKNDSDSSQKTKITSYFSSSPSKSSPIGTKTGEMA